MEIKEFISKFTEAIEESNDVTEQTEFKSLETWDSIAILSIIAMIDEEFGVSISGTELSKLPTISDLFELIKSKQ